MGQRTAGSSMGQRTAGLLRRPRWARSPTPSGGPPGLANRPWKSSASSTIMSVTSLSGAGASLAASHTVARARAARAATSSDLMWFMQATSRIRRRARVAGAPSSQTRAALGTAAARAFQRQREHAELSRPRATLDGWEFGSTVAKTGRLEVRCCPRPEHSCSRSSCRQLSPPRPCASGGKGRRLGRRDLGTQRTGAPS